MTRRSKEINEQSQGFHRKNPGQTLPCLYCRGQMTQLPEGLWHCSSCMQDVQRGFNQYRILRNR